MERVAQGGAVTLTAEFQTGAGDLTDPTGPTVDVIDAEDVQVVTDDEPTRLSLGRYTYTYVVPADAPLGVWRVHWGGTVDGLASGGDDWFDVVTPGAILTSAYDLLTLDEAKAALNIPAADDTFDDEVALYVTAVSQRLDDECGPIVKRTVTETRDGGDPVIFLAHPPVASVASVTEYRSGTAAVLAAETTTVRTADDWYLEGVYSVLRRRSHGSDSRFATGRGNVVVVYTAGRFDSTAAVSAKFKQAAAKMLAWLWKGDQGVGSSTFGGGEGASLFGLGFALPNVVKELLVEERRPPVVA